MCVCVGGGGEVRIICLSWITDSNTCVPVINLQKWDLSASTKPPSPQNWSNVLPQRLKLRCTKTCADCKWDMTLQMLVLKQNWLWTVLNLRKWMSITERNNHMQYTNAKRHWISNKCILQIITLGYLEVQNITAGGTPWMKKAKNLWADNQQRNIKCGFQVTRTFLQPLGLLGGQIYSCTTGFTE